MKKMKKTKVANISDQVLFKFAQHTSQVKCFFESCMNSKT